MHFLRVSLLLLCLWGVSSAGRLQRGLAEDLAGIEDRLFENDIRKFLEEIRGILKNGDPENNIPPMEPLPIPFYDFDFILQESRLDGYIGPLLVHNISDFVVTNVNFNVVLFKINLGLQFPVLKIDGGYKLHGNIFEEPVDSEGTFVADTTNLDLNVMVHIGSNLNRTVIKELELDFTFDNDNIAYILKSGESGNMDNTYLQPLFYRIRDEYFPLLLNTLNLVGSDLIHDVTLDQLLKIIIDIIQGNALELITTKYH